MLWVPFGDIYYIYINIYIYIYMYIYIYIYIYQNTCVESVR